MHITPHQHAVTQQFDLHAREAGMRAQQPVGFIIRGLYNVLRARYTLYNAEGMALAAAQTRMFPAGRHFVWAVHLEIQAADGRAMGSISGELTTAGAAQFAFYDTEGLRIGVAQLQQGGRACALVATHTPRQPAAQLQRQAGPSSKASATAAPLDPWQLQADPSSFDARLLYLFAAFVVDHQNEFVTP